MEAYYKVVTKSGKHYNFNRRCNRIDYHNERLCVFNHFYDGKREYETLALIPYSSIECILKFDETGECL